MKKGASDVTAVIALLENGRELLFLAVACHAKRKKLSGKTQKIPFKMTFGYILKGIFLSMYNLYLLMENYCQFTLRTLARRYRILKLSIFYQYYQA